MEVTEVTSSNDDAATPSNVAQHQAAASQASQPLVPGSLLAAWVIGPYLVVQTLALAYFATLTAFASDGQSLAKWLVFLPEPLSVFVAELTEDNFRSFQRNAIATCSAGLGGAVFMLREFYLNFAYGKKRLGQKRLFLRAREIPRYVLLPFSSCILGPIGLALLQAGAIVFAGFSAGKDIPQFTTIAVCFLLGFSYHDTLGGLRDLSKKFWGGRAGDRKTTKH
jgi:hypothetical protein